MAISFTTDSSLEGLLKGVALRNSIRRLMKKVEAGEISSIRVVGRTGSAYWQGVTPDWVKANGWVQSVSPNGEIVVRSTRTPPNLNLPYWLATG